MNSALIVNVDAMPVARNFTGNTTVTTTRDFSSRDSTRHRTEKRKTECRHRIEFLQSAEISQLRSSLMDLLLNFLKDSAPNFQENSHGNLTTPITPERPENIHFLDTKNMAEDSSGESLLEEVPEYMLDLCMHQVRFISRYFSYEISCLCFEVYSLSLLPSDFMLYILFLRCLEFDLKNDPAIKQSKLFDKSLKELIPLYKACADLVGENNDFLKRIFMEVYFETESEINNSIRCIDDSNQQIQQLDQENNKLDPSKDLEKLEELCELLYKLMSQINFTDECAVSKKVFMSKLNQYEDEDDSSSDHFEYSGSEDENNLDHIREFVDKYFEGKDSISKESLKELESQLKQPKEQIKMNKEEINKLRKSSAIERNKIERFKLSYGTLYRLFYPFKDFLDFLETQLDFGYGLYGQEENSVDFSHSCKQQLSDYWEKTFATEIQKLGDKKEIERRNKIKHFVTDI